MTDISYADLLAEWLAFLDAALEHGRQAWDAMIHEGLLPKGTTMDKWPPEVTTGVNMENVGHVPYHVASMIWYVYRVYDKIIAKEQDDGCA